MVPIWSQSDPSSDSLISFSPVLLWCWFPSEIFSSPWEIPVCCWHLLLPFLYGQEGKTSIFYFPAWASPLVPRKPCSVPAYSLRKGIAHSVSAPPRWAPNSEAGISFPEGWEHHWFFIWGGGADPCVVKPFLMPSAVLGEAFHAAPPLTTRARGTWLPRWVLGSCKVSHVSSWKSFLWQLRFPCVLSGVADSHVPARPACVLRAALWTCPHGICFLLHLCSQDTDRRASPWKGCTQGLSSALPAGAPVKEMATGRGFVPLSWGPAETSLDALFSPSLTSFPFPVCTTQIRTLQHRSQVVNSTPNQKAKSFL